MRAEVTHQQKFKFESKIREHSLVMDTKQAAGGDNAGPSPKELLLASIIGCTGMDIIAILKKHNITPQKLHITADADPRQEHPRVFPAINLNFELEDERLSADVALDAVRQSLTKYCGVSAMVSKVSPIFYQVRLNGTDAGRGEADFGL